MNIDMIIAEIMEANFKESLPKTASACGMRTPQKADCHEEYLDKLVKNESEAVLSELKISR